MNTTSKAIVVVSIALASLSQTTVSSFADETRVSGPYYQLISPARGNTPARYRYYENGDNPNFGSQVYSDSDAQIYSEPVAHNQVVRRQATRRRNCGLGECSSEGRMGRFLGGVLAGVIFGPAFN